MPPSFPTLDNIGSDTASTTMDEKHSETRLPVPTTEEYPSASESPSVATSLKAAPYELEKERGTSDIDVRDDVSPAGTDADDDVYFHGMQLLPVFIAIMLAVFLIAIDQVRSVVPYLTSSYSNASRQLSVLPFRRSQISFRPWRVCRGTAPPTS